MSQALLGARFLGRRHRGVSGMDLDPRRYVHTLVNSTPNNQIWAE